MAVPGSNPCHTPIINGKQYNDYKMGGFILLVPVYGKQGEQLVFGELKDFKLSEKVDQLFDKDFVPEKKEEPKPEQKLEPEPGQPALTNDYTQTDGYKVRELRTSLKETQAKFARHFNVAQTLVSQWETNKVNPPKEVLEWQPTQTNESEATNIAG